MILIILDYCPPQEEYSSQNESTNHSSAGNTGSGGGNGGNNNHNMDVHTNGGGSPAQSPQSADSNSNAPTSSLPSSMLPAARHSLLAASDGNASITPSISLIPIKQVRSHCVMISRVVVATRQQQHLNSVSI